MIRAEKITKNQKLNVANTFILKPRENSMSPEKEKQQFLKLGSFFLSIEQEIYFELKYLILLHSLSIENRKIRNTRQYNFLMLITRTVKLQKRTRRSMERSDILESSATK